MADVVDAIRTRLTEHAGTAALIGERAWFALLPQDPTLPAVRVQQISGRRVSAMGQDVGKAEGRVQTDGYASTRAGAKALAEQVRLALQRFRGTVGSTVIDEVMLDSETERFESETGLWRVQQDWTVWWTE